MRLLSLLLLCGCADAGRSPATVQAGVAANRVTASTSAPVVPLVDHHQHLLSPAGAALINRPILPEAPVPPAVAELLRRRADLSGDAAQLSGLFTEDAMFLAPTKSGGWVRGSMEAARSITTFFAPGYRMTPVSYSASGSTAQIAGYFTRGEGASLRHPGFFHMSLRQEPDGAWRISAETPAFPGPFTEPVVDAERLVQLLDAAGVRRAIVLSDAYYFDRPDQPAEHAYERVRAENDWTAGEVARFPDRLVAFCSFNPLADYALAELERCATKLRFRGLKLHFDTSGVDLRKAEQARKVRAVVDAANRLRLPVIVHVVGVGVDARAVTETLLRDIVPGAADVPFIVAHLWGGGPFSDELLGMYADAVRSGNPAFGTLSFELAQASMVAGSPTNLEAVARRIREIGIDRIYFGSDSATPPKEAWAEFRAKVPLSEAEFHRIATNVAPFLR